MAHHISFCKTRLGWTLKQIFWSRLRSSESVSNWHSFFLIMSIIRIWFLLPWWPWSRKSLEWHSLETIRSKESDNWILHLYDFFLWCHCFRLIFDEESNQRVASSIKMTGWKDRLLNAGDTRVLCEPLNVPNDLTIYLIWLFLECLECANIGLKVPSLWDLSKERKLSKLWSRSAN